MDIPEKVLIETIAKSLVDDPGAVNVNVITGEKSTILELRVGAGDVGKIIGRGGEIAKAMRRLVMAVSVKNGRHVVFEILD